MKIRIKDNSIRLRLTKTDIKNLNEHQLVSCKTVISGSETFKYELQSGADLDKISVKFSQGTIVVTIPINQAKILIDTDEITIKGTQDNGTEEPLFILIEKDLECLDATDEDQSDMFENKKSVC